MYRSWSSEVGGRKGGSLHDIHFHEDPNWPYDVSDGTSPYYRSFWWGKGNKERDLNGYGIHGQLLRVAPEAEMVVAIYSTWPQADGDNNNQYWDSSLLIQIEQIGI